MNVWANSQCHDEIESNAGGLSIQVNPKDTAETETIGEKENAILNNPSARDDASGAEQTAIDDEGSHRVLVVSSDLSARREFKENLRAAVQRFITYGAASGEEALSIVERLNIDCVVLSDHLPDVHYLKLIRHFTNCTTLAALPVVVIGESTEGSTGQAALDSGAAGYLSKSSVTPETLRSMITNAIAQDRLARVIEIQNRQIQLLCDERRNYKHLTDELAHELLTPLAAVQEFVSLVFDGIAGPISEEQRKHLAYARGGCHSIRSSVESLVVKRELEKIFSDETQR